MKCRILCQLQHILADSLLNRPREDRRGFRPGPPRTYAADGLDSPHRTTYQPVSVSRARLSSLLRARRQLAGHVVRRLERSAISPQTAAFRVEAKGILLGDLSNERSSSASRAARACRMASAWPGHARSPWRGPCAAFGQEVLTREFDQHNSRVPRLCTARDSRDKTPKAHPAGPESAA